ncbi:MAG: glycosyltransferase family 2 protein, partial [Syntrophobacteraceae bacterium]
MNRNPLSVAIITKNAENKLGACLESVAFADEIVIVDSGSTDRTEEVAKKFDVRWHCEPWKGYGPQKNSAIAKCSHDWVLSIDHDERVPVETARKITEILSSEVPADAYSFRRKNFFRGRWIKVAGWWPDEVTRLLRKSRGKYVRLIHEDWETEGRVEKTPFEIEHYSFDTYSDMFLVMNSYSTLTAEQLHAEGKTAGPADALFRLAWMFFRTYFLKLGFVAGFDGF